MHCASQLKNASILIRARGMHDCSQLAACRAQEQQIAGTATGACCNAPTHTSRSVRLGCRCVLQVLLGSGYDAAVHACECLQDCATGACCSSRRPSEFGCCAAALHCVIARRILSIVHWTTACAYMPPACATGTPLHKLSAWQICPAGSFRSACGGAASVHWPPSLPAAVSNM